MTQEKVEKPEQPQTVEEFLSTGGKVQYVEPGVSGQIDPRKQFNPLVYTPGKSRGKW